MLKLDHIYRCAPERRPRLATTMVIALVSFAIYGNDS